MKEYKDYYEEGRSSAFAGFGLAVLTVWTIISILPLMFAISLSNANHQKDKEIDRLERLSAAQSKQIKLLTKGEEDE